MPHDAKGRELKPGDLVVVPFVVKQVHQTEHFCNVDLETCATMPPDNRHKTSLSAINTKMLLRANQGDDLGFAVLNKVTGESLIVEPPQNSEPEVAPI